MATIEIDGKEIKTQPGAMIIEAADAAGIYIPRFCYHNKLSIAANCRMCLVEVEKSRKPLPACATPVTDGMKVYTKSPLAISAQKNVMEFLLINHPLDCPICDQGGECELQDLSMGYGRDNSLYTDCKRSVADDDLGPLISTEMTRCIHCTRCVRFGQEIAGVRELGATHRGEEMQITTYVKHTLKSEMSANIIDLCPVGALTSKPYRFTARAWELKQTNAIAAHDCIGSNIAMHTRNGDVMRVVPRDNEAINEAWLSDRDRFSYLGLNSDDRVTKPMIKQVGEWVEVDWVSAFEIAANALQKVIKQHGAEQVAALAHPSTTIEEQYLLQKFMRGIGSNNIDHRLQITDVSDQNSQGLYPSLGISLEELENQDAILLVGSNIQREQPIAAHRVRKATLNGAKVSAVNCIDYTYYFDLTHKIVSHPNELVRSLAQIAKALMDQHDSGVPQNVQGELSQVEVTEEAKRIADTLSQGERKLVLMGAIANSHPNASSIRMLTALIAQITGANIGVLTSGANSAGAWLAGCVPHRGIAGQKLGNPGLAHSQMLDAELKAFILLGMEPALDCENPNKFVKALKQADCVIAITPYASQVIKDTCEVILPSVPFSETSGTYVNAMGTWQSFDASTAPRGEARPAWKVLRVLGNFFKLHGFDYVSSDDILQELKNHIDDAEEFNAEVRTQAVSFDAHTQGLKRIAAWPLYRTDGIVRRSRALQESLGSDPLAVYLNEKTANEHQLKDGMPANVSQHNGKVTLTVSVDNRIPDGCIYVPNGFVETSVLGESFGDITISNAS